ncbi:MAG TPA: helix-turn-helix domain-containing protein [Polyangia bacterium]|jgi:excisionase family DNA binding protein|nr:helix-turn-helix domain-containing protein [Polyangia bacterium]
MPKRTSPEGALFVRLPAAAVDKLDRAAEALGMRKKDLVAGLVSKYVDPDSRRGLSTLGTLSTHGATVDLRGAVPTHGAYSFRPYDPPEVMNAEQAGQFLQVDEDVVTEMAVSGDLPARKIGDAWRFSRAALVAWLSKPEKR